jgi:xanthosine utilization system XapX-like protein
VRKLIRDATVWLRSAWAHLRSRTRAEWLLWGGLALVVVGLVLVGCSTSGGKAVPDFEGPFTFVRHGFVEHGAAAEPIDAERIVYPALALVGSLGAIIGGVLAGIAKIIQARGQADSARFRALAVLVRAQSDAARHGDRLEVATQSRQRVMKQPPEG